MAVLGGLEIDREGAYQPGQDTARADCREVAAYIVGFPFLGRERARDRRCLHDANHGDHQRQLHHAAQLLDAGQGRQGEARQRHRERTEQTDAAGVKMKQGHGEARPRQGDQGTGNPGADPRRAQGHDQDAGAERERVGIGLPDPPEGMNKAHKHMPPLLGDTQQGRQLPHDNVDRDAGEETRRDRDRQHRGEPTCPEQADGDENDADQNCEQRGQLGIVRGAGSGDRG